MKTVRHYRTAKDKLLHIETEGAVINIRVGLRNRDGHNVTHVEVLPDVNGDGCGNPPWMIADDPEAKACNIRLVQNSYTPLNKTEVKDMTKEELELELDALDAKNKAEIARLDRIDPLRQQFASIELSADEINRMGELAGALDAIKRIEIAPALERIRIRKEIARKRNS